MKPSRSSRSGKFVALCALIGFLIPAAAFAQAPPPLVVITAQQIALHPDRALLIADGGVAIRIGSAKPVQATRASYDLKTNRLTAVGDDAGSGLVFDFTANKQISAPNSNVPQLGTLDALATGQQIELRPAESITFSNAQVLAGSTFVPAATYTYAIPSPKYKDFGYSPVPSAALEWDFLTASSPDFYAFTRARYDKYNGGPGTGLEEHFAATSRGYAVLGETYDADGARYDFSSYERINGALSQTFTATSLIGAQTARYALISSTPHGYLSFAVSQYNQYRSDDLYLSGNEHAVARFLSMRFQFDLTHEVHPFDWDVAQDLRATPGVHVDTAAWHLGASSISGSADVGEALYSYGRATLSSTGGFWGNAPVTQRLLLSGGATFSHNAPPYPSTSRTYTLGAAWKASDAFNVVSSLNYTHDFGQAFDFGRPQFSAAFDVRVRRRNHTGVEVGVVAPFGGVGNRYRQGVFNLRFFKW